MYIYIYIYMCMYCVMVTVVGSVFDRLSLNPE